MSYISAKYAELVAAYRRAQDATDANAWTDRPDAPFRIRSFIGAPVRDDTEE